MHVYSQEFSTLDLDFRLEVSLPEEAPAGVEVIPSSAAPETADLKIQVSQAGANPGMVPVKGSFTLSWSLPITEMHGLLTFPPSQAEMGILPM